MTEVAPTSRKKFVLRAGWLPAGAVGVGIWMILAPDGSHDRAIGVFSLIVGAFLSVYFGPLLAGRPILKSDHLGLVLSGSWRQGRVPWEEIDYFGLTTPRILFTKVRLLGIAIRDLYAPSVSVSRSQRRMALRRGFLSVPLDYSTKTPDEVLDAIQHVARTAGFQFNRSPDGTALIRA